MRFSDVSDLFEARMGKRDLENVKTSKNFTIGFEFEMVVSNDAIEDFKNELDTAYYKPELMTEKELMVDLLAEKVDMISSYKVSTQDIYHAKEKDSSVWTIEPDGSIKPQGAEIVSPVFRNLDEALMELEGIFSITDQTIYTNSSTGLHVNIGTFDHTEIDVLKLLLFLGEKHIMDTFGRDKNEYTQPLIRELLDRIVNNPRLEMSSPTFEKKMKALNEFLLSRSKNFSFNVEKLIKHGYLEFRIIGGDYTDRLDEVKNTINRYIRVVNIASNPNAFKNEYVKKLQKLLSSSNYSDYVDSLNDNLTSRITSALMTISNGKWKNRRDLFSNMDELTSNPEAFIKALTYSSPDEKVDITANLKVEIRSIYTEILKKYGENLDNDIIQKYTNIIKSYIKNKNTAKFLISLLNVKK